MSFRLEGLDHVALTVRDVEMSAKWYRQTLGLEAVHPGAWGGVPTMVGTGSTAIALFPVGTPEPEPKPGAGVLAVRHFAFRATRQDFDRARESLPRMGVEIEFQDHEIAHSIYFHDPDGHTVEITTYEMP